MSVNGITSSESSYTSKVSSASSNAKAKVNNEAPKAETVQDGAVYESSGKAKYVKVANPDMVAYLKSTTEERTNQLQNIVKDLMMKQGQAYGAANDMWKFLASGNFEVDAATKAQAQADIAEDGFWGVEATSDRIIDFAKALAGDNPEMLEKMRGAFEKGFAMARETWGGELPDISQRTYEAVQKKFDALINPAEEE